jgi:predicted ester cyclase
MTPEEEAERSRELVRRIFEEGINDGNDTVLHELLAPGFVNHDLPSPRPGPDGFAMVVGVFRSAFDDMKFYVDEVLVDGALVSTRGYLTGLHKGEFMGVQPSGEQILVKYIDQWRFEDGQAQESWVSLDLLGLMQQIGAIGS